MSKEGLNKYQQNFLTSSVEKITITKDTEAADSTSQTETIIEPTYVSVIDPFTREIIELPTHEDDSLTLSTLSHAIPGACGLKYHNPGSGTQRALLMDPAGLKFLSPYGGWKGKQFTVIFSQPSCSYDRTKYTSFGHNFYRPGDQIAKRRKLMDDDCLSCYDCSDEDGFEGISLTNIKQKRSKNDDDGDDSQTEEATSDLIVLGIPYSNTEEDLRKYFEKFGTVTVSQVKKKEDGQSKGYGFIRMLDYKSQMKVLRSSPLRIDNRTVTVKIPNNTKQSEESCSVVEKPNIRKRLFVSRITEDLTQEILKNFFTKEARKSNPNNSVTSVFIPRPFRSFAFISFSNDSCISKLVKKNNYIINGVSVAVEVSNFKEYQITNSQESTESNKSTKYNDRSLETRIDALNLNQPIKQELEEAAVKDDYSENKYSLSQ